MLLIVALVFYVALRFYSKIISILSNYKQRKHWGKLQDIWIGKKALKNDINYEYLSKE